ncbi:MAG: hypothetical protein ABW186_08140 [Rhodanobacteraceae bacterium]
MDPSPGKFHSEPDSLDPRKFQQKNVRGGHQHHAQRRELRPVADDERAEVEPFAQAVDETEQAEHGPRVALGFAPCNGAASDAEQDESQPVEKEDEIELIAEKGRHFLTRAGTPSLCRTAS